MKKFSKFLDRDFNSRLMWLLQVSVVFIVLAYIIADYNKAFSWISIAVSVVLLVVSVGYGFVKSTPVEPDENFETKR